MKVLQVNKLYYPHIGGIEKVVQDITEGLKDKIQLEVLVCQNKGKGKRETINGVEIIRASSLGIYFSSPVSFSFPFLLKELSEDKDILHFHMPFPIGEASFFFSSFKGPIVCTYHSDIVRQKFLMKFYKPLLVRFLGRANRIITSSQAIIENSPLLRNFRNKCKIIPFGIDPERFELTSTIQEKVQEIKERYKKRIILFVGRLVYYKGIEFLLKAMIKVDAKLVIIGQGVLEEKLKKLTKKLNIGDKIAWIKRVNDSELVAYYHSCELFVLPSVEKTEAFGIVQLEAQACGKPVVSTNLVTGVPFVNLHEKTGLVVPPREPEALAQAINKLLNEPILREKYGKNGEERVEREFTKETMIKKIYNLYREVLNS